MIFEIGSFNLKFDSCVIRICDDQPIGSLTFFDVGIIIVRSIREQTDIRRAFEVFYTQ